MIYERRGAGHSHEEGKELSSDLSFIGTPLQILHMGHSQLTCIWSLDSLAVSASCTEYGLFVPTHISSEMF